MLPCQIAGEKADKRHARIRALRPRAFALPCLCRIAPHLPPTCPGPGAQNGSRCADLDLAEEAAFRKNGRRSSAGHWRGTQSDPVVRSMGSEKRRGPTDAERPAMAGGTDDQGGGEGLVMALPFEVVVAQDAKDGPSGRPEIEAAQACGRASRGAEYVKIKMLLIFKVVLC